VSTASNNNNATKPIIGINGDYRQSRSDSVALSWFNSGYYDSVSASGGIPLLIPPLAEDGDLEQILENVEGVVLAGCTLDLDPVRLGLNKHPATRVMPTRREDFDRRLCKMAVERRLPILAIGSGMQTLNVVTGGSLYQHIDEDLVDSLCHRDRVESILRHVLDIVPGTRVDAIYGPGEIRVNSQHHMSVNQLSSLFRVSATCPDGVIESYESVVDDWFCLGVQWHPESENSSALDMQVFEHFVDACVPAAPAVLPMPGLRQAA
jgi:putative glutamine amidotransferase